MAVSYNMYLSYEHKIEGNFYPGTGPTMRWYPYRLYINKAYFRSYDGIKYSVLI